jgi:hypothetical protein
VIVSAPAKAHRFPSGGIIRYLVLPRCFQNADKPWWLFLSVQYELESSLCYSLWIQAALLPLIPCSLQHLQQGFFQLAHRNQTLELAANNSLAVDDKDPRLSAETPLVNRTLSYW